METQQIDARGLECPKPVIATKKALETMASGVVVTLVDNEVACKNVVRLAEGMALPVEVKEVGGTYEVTINKNDAFVMGMVNDLTPSPALTKGDLAVFLSAATLGRGNDELGSILMKSFLYTLASADDMPRWIVMVNSGVTLACEGSAFLETLQTMADKGTDIIVCGTCLDFYGIKDKVAVGRISNMYEIVDVLKKAGNKLTV